MTTLHLSDRSLKQTELSLTTYLAPHLMAWLSGSSRHHWQYSADWLAAHGVGVDDPSEASVQDRIDLLERLRVL